MTSTGAKDVVAASRLALAYSSACGGPPPPDTFYQRLTASNAMTPPRCVTLGSVNRPERHRHPRYALRNLDGDCISRDGIRDLMMLDLHRVHRLFDVRRGSASIAVPDDVDAVPLRERLGQTQTGHS